MTWCMRTPLLEPEQDKQGDWHNCLCWPSIVDKPVAPGPLQKNSENMSCLRDITALTLTPAVYFLELFNGNLSPLKPNMIDEKVAMLYHKGTYLTSLLNHRHGQLLLSESAFGRENKK